MPKWSQQEQQILLIVLTIFLVGLAGRAWLRHRPEAPATAHSLPAD